MCSVTQALIEDADGASTVDLIAEKDCSPEILKKAGERNLPVVSHKWIIQTLITGKKPDLDSNSNYKPCSRAPLVFLVVPSKWPVITIKFTKMVMENGNLRP